MSVEALDQILFCVKFVQHDLVGTKVCTIHLLFLCIIETMLSCSIIVLHVKHFLPVTLTLPCYNMSVETLDQILLFAGFVIW